ncbi:MAG: 30S ribosomal protein S20 [Omnitrophica bacterium RIFCSPHIGHO2_02_FULL_51_18]|nr:MAG: 30S ribosomal protein S20 [Omnitrophica bacterium RIFCSPHIGHO2_02_FULL_51_18]
MAHRRSSIKKIRIDKKRRALNVQTLSDLRTIQRKVKTLIVGNKKPEALALSRDLFSKLDKAVKKGLIHKNLASRQKSRTTLKINAIKV